MIEFTNVPEQLVDLIAEMIEEEVEVLEDGAGSFRVLFVGEDVTPAEETSLATVAITVAFSDHPELFGVEDDDDLDEAVLSFIVRDDITGKVLSIHTIAPHGWLLPSEEICDWPFCNCGAPEVEDDDPEFNALFSLLEMLEQRLQGQKI